MNHIFSYLVSKSVRWYEKKGHIQVQGDPRWPNGCSFEWSDVVSQAIEYPLVSSAPWFAGKSPSNRSIIFPVFCPHHGWRGLFSIVKSPLSTWAFPKIWGNPKSPWVSIPRWTSLGWFVGTSMTWVNFPDLLLNQAAAFSEEMKVGDKKFARVGLKLGYLLSKWAAKCVPSLEW